MIAPRLARGDVGHVDLEHRERHRLDRVVQRHAVLRQRGRIEQRAVERVDALVQLVDEHALVVRLQRLELDAALVSEAMQPLVDLRQGRRAVDVRLAAAEQVQVGAVQDQEFHGSSRR